MHAGIASRDTRVEHINCLISVKQHQLVRYYNHIPQPLSVRHSTRYNERSYFSPLLRDGLEPVCVCVSDICSDFLREAVLNVGRCDRGWSYVASNRSNIIVILLLLEYLISVLAVGHCWRLFYAVNE